MKSLRDFLFAVLVGLVLAGAVWSFGHLTEYQRKRWCDRTLARARTPDDSINFLNAHQECLGDIWKGIQK